MDFNYVQPIVEILAESAFGHHPLEITVGGKQDPGAERDGRVLPSRVNSLCLQQRAAAGSACGLVSPISSSSMGSVAGLFEIASPACRGPGEGPLFAAEHLGFDQGFRD